MMHGKKVATAVLAISILPLSGCFLKKKKPAVLPPRGQAPTITVPLGAQLPPEAPPEATPVPSVEAPKPTATKPKKKRAPKKTPPVNAGVDNSQQPKPGTQSPVVAKNNNRTVNEGGAPDSNVQISADVPRDAAAQQRQETSQLLDTTETNLRKIGSHTLNDGDQATMRQIRNYITQSRLAMQDGDLERAYNLATKANLLCNEMVKKF